MASWRTRGLVKKALEYLPAGNQLHYLLQRKVGALRDVKGECRNKIEDWRLMVGHMQTVGQPLAGAQMMELGSGWYPALPLCLYVGGVGTVETFDLNRHMRPELLLVCIETIGDSLLMIAEAADAAVEDVFRRHNHALRTIRAGASVRDATEGRVVYHAPADARNTRLADNSLDWSFSNSVLEHLPADDIVACMRESYRVLRPGKFMFHSVNCGDHYAYTDSSINQLHYLYYSEAQWGWWQSKFLWQNRLRATDFVAMAQDAHFEIVVDTSTPREVYLDALRKMLVHPSFSCRYTEEELCLTTIDFVGRKPD